MPALPCSRGIYEDIALAIQYLHQGSSDSPVIAWWEHEGQRLTFLVPLRDIPREDRPIICENLAYIRRVLRDAMVSHDARTVEYAVTRLVSNVEELTG